MANSQAVVSALYAKVVTDVIAKSRARARGCQSTRGHHSQLPPQEEFLGEGLDATVLEELRVVRAALCSAARVTSEADAPVRSAGSASSRKAASCPLRLPRLPRRQTPLPRCGGSCLVLPLTVVSEASCPGACACSRPCASSRHTSAGPCASFRAAAAAAAASVRVRITSIYALLTPRRPPQRPR